MRNRKLFLARTFLKYFIFHKFNFKNYSLGKRIRLACEDLGSSSIKFGQLLSTRYEYFSREDCFEMQKLLSDVRIVPEGIIRKIFFDDFGFYPEEVFESWERISTASVSQVYRARTFNGKILAVKIKKPGLENNIREDMNTLISFSKFLMIFPAFKRLNIANMLTEIKMWMLEEIDFVNEKNNILKARNYFDFLDDVSPFDKIELLDIEEKFCSENVLTTRFVDGILLSNVDDVKENSDYDYFMSVKNNLRLFLYPLFHKENFLFQGDPHMANFIVKKNGGMAPLDYGFLTEIKKEDLVKFKKLMLAVYSKDLDETVKWALIMCDVRGKKFRKLSRKIREEVAQFLRIAEFRGTGYWFTELPKIVIRHGVRVPTCVAAFGRACIAYDGIIQSYNPNITTLDLLREELNRGLTREVVRNIKKFDPYFFVYRLSEKADKLPKEYFRRLEKCLDKPERVLFEMKRVLDILRR